MVSAAPDVAAAAEYAVHSLGDPNGEALKPARERAHIHRLDEEMNVIPLDRKLDEPQTAT